MKKIVIFISILLMSIQGYSIRNVEKEGVKVGQIAPNIVLKDTSRDEVKLNSLRENIVLVHFWASWCPSCRKENSKLVQVYKKYRSKTFTQGEKFEIFAISLDKKEKYWKDAIKKDQLFWDYNVCDFKGWYGTYPKRYKINAIPNNILINGKGIIIARDLNCKELEKKLECMSK
ncbi:TlpA family protein disulfide reductase [Halosquirtibacter xylanolyticus]|uniref:TlpA family protein disulfide reductase n=1 Tax=Halosquirtibacter xylanolyticus TaxID=3374599 RepID=UPI003747E775|nr:TlpA family protein disulfide reductase [Prolixibacteraceae bacterium]